ncbi:MAG: efflux RND transporter periplasmic adaptor subunit [Minisyncoccia bacterium]
MAKATRSFLRWVWNLSLRTKIGIGIGVVIILTAGYFIFVPRPTVYQLIPVTKGPITETVSVTGNTTPIASVSIGFQNGGTIAHIYYNLGSVVSAGAVVAELNTANLSAALQQAQANVDAEQATLEGLQAGSQPQDIAASQAALQGAQQTLANLYAGISDAATSGYAKANDAVRTQLDTLFSNAETNQPQLTFETSDSQAAINATALRVSASTELNAWQQELDSISPLSSPDALTAALTNELGHLAVVQNLLNVVSTTLDGNIDLSATQLAADKANVSAGLAEVNAAISSLNTISQNIASQQSTVAEAEAELALKQAGSTPEAIAAQEAQVEQAKAGVASAEANLQGSRIVAPISGTVTQQDAKIGQQATPGTPLVSIIGTGGFEVDAGVSETDVGKLTVGDPVTMTLDAFPNETFAGTVFYIAPAETNTGGVISYLIKISFDKPDPRLKSGLTANVDIQTKHEDNALILPQYAILQNDNGTFVETLIGGVTTTTPVALGIQDQSGNVEVLSGVTEGEQVINIGLKTP